MSMPGFQRPTLAQLVGLDQMNERGLVRHDVPRAMILPFPAVSYAGMQGKSKLAVCVQQIFRAQQLCIDPYSCGFFNVVDLRIQKCSQFVNPNPIPAIAFHSLALQENSLKLDTANIGSLIELEVARNARKIRLCVSVRDGAELPEDWKDCPEQIRRLHYAHPRTCGEVDVPYDFSWDIPDWALARIADYEKEVGQELDEPELQECTFRAYLKGMTLVSP